MAQLPPIGGPAPALPGLPPQPPTGAPDLGSILGGAPGLTPPAQQSPLTPPPPGPGVGGNLNIPNA